MHLVFPNGEHDKVALGKGTFSIGAAESCEVTLCADGLLDNHAMVAVDHRGITLLAEADGIDIKVNDRSVESKSILRLGDQLQLAGVTVLLHGDLNRLNDLSSATGQIAEANREHPPRFLVRGLNGPLTGQAVSLFDQLKLGGASDQLPLPDVEAEAVLEVEQNGVFLRHARGMQVNGHQVSEAQLRAGDQIVAGHHRFLLEAPGFVPGKAYSGVAEAVTGSGNTQVFTAPVVPAPSGSENSSGSGVNSNPGAGQSSGDGPVENSDTRRRDTIIVAVCLALSAAMVGWLLMNYLF